MEFEAFEFGTLEFGKFEFGRLEVETLELICLELGIQEAATIGFAWLLLGTLAEFEAFEFGIQAAGTTLFGKREVERCELICLELWIQEAEVIGLAWSFLGIFETLAISVEFEALEFGKREFEKAETWELICLESAIRGAGTTGFAWLLLETLAKFANAEIEEFEFGIQEAAKWE